MFWHFWGFCIKPWEDCVLKQIKITATFHRKNIFISKFIFSVEFQLLVVNKSLTFEASGEF